jgi:hypothetical protein
LKEPIPKHEKVRFRRGDVTGWHAYPSAGGDALRPRPTLFPRWLLRPVKWAAVALGGLVLVAAALLLVIPSTGIESEWLRGQAERAVARVAGDQVDARIGRTTLALDRRHFLAIGIDDLAVSGADAETPFARAGRLGLGVRFWPLLSGRVEIGSVTLSDARVSVPPDMLLSRGGGAGVMTEDGLIDPDRLLEAVFAGLETAAGQTASAGLETVRLNNVEIAAGDAFPAPITIVTGKFSLSGDGDLALSAEIAALDQVITLSGEAGTRRDEPTNFRVEAVVAESGKTYEVGAARPEDSGTVRLGEMSLVAEGRAGGKAGPAGVSVTASVGRSDVTVGTSGEFQANAAMRARLTEGAGALWIDRFDLEVARSRFTFSGLLTPQPSAEDGRSSARYAFQMIGPDIKVAPLESPEPALAVLARVTGWIAPNGRRIVANEINVATGQGEVIGSGALEIEPGVAPGVSLAIGVAQMPVSHAKNLWPFFAAPGARRWVLANVFGGVVENSRLLMRTEPGRLGDGLPLTSEEVSGHFEVSNTRFDVAGTIPPMRDAVGTVDFAGTDVDIALKSGTIFMESGRSLAARNGTLTIDDAHIKPLIGKVDVEIDGAAAAVTEVAGYEPINLSRYLPISPDTISGTAQGRLQASVPFEQDISRDDLDWHLELAYEDLSLDQPYEGQHIENADGTIVAGPQQANFVAEATLNGIRGELTLSEPLGTDKSARKRKARLFLERGDSDKLFAGLSDIVSGPMTLEVEQLGPGREKVHADLTNARLTLPWIGWSKKEGTAATADFTMNRDGETNRLEDFRISGDGFGGSGTLTVDENGLARARLNNLAFNPGDSISLGVDRAGNNYTINVAGQALDARFLIKRFATLSTATAEGGGGGPSVKVNAEVSRIAGFNGETMIGAKLAYSDSGSGVPGFRISAATPDGARSTIVDATAGGMRKLEIKADNAGAVLRFLDIYDKLGGGRAALSLAGQTGGALRGQLEIRDFALIDEARLQSMVDRAPPGSERSLNDAINSNVDVSRARFDRGFASVVLGGRSLTVTNGVVSGPSVGSTFEGTVFDGEGNMAISGTFLPAYGINRIFGEIPLLGQILGGGRGGGLIGITYRLSGPAEEPRLEINPLSAVAPGIFRSIFEYR